MLSTYDPVGMVFYAIVNDPSVKSATLWSYNTQNYAVKSFPVAYGTSAMSYDTISKTIFATYNNMVYKVNPLTGSRQSYFQIFPASLGYTTVGVPANSAWNPPLFNIMVQQGDPTNMSSFACFFIYTVNPSTKQTQVSKCYPNTLAPVSVGVFTLAYMFQIPSNPPNTNFLAVNYNVQGPNYDYIYPSNYTIIDEVLGYSDFSALEWTFTQDPTSYTYNPTNGCMWGKYTDVYDDVILGGAVLNAPSIPTYLFYIWETTSNIQVIWSANMLKHKL